MKLFGDEEIDLIEDFKMLSSEEIAVVGNEEKIDKIIDSVKNIEKWINTSGKGDLPPDFYNEKEKIMMEVMRVDDHGYQKHHKIINPTYLKENKIRKELEEKGFDKLFPNAKLIANVDTGLTTNEDHNYKYYFKNFERTISHHVERIKNYRKNHEGYKLILYIYDESSAYIEAESKNRIGVCGKAHYYFLDKKFVECFENEDIDYLIWMAPYKRYEFVGDGIQLPTAIIYDLNNFNEMLIEYNEEKIISSEK